MKPSDVILLPVSSSPVSSSVFCLPRGFSRDGDDGGDGEVDEGAAQCRRTCYDINR